MRTGQVRASRALASGSGSNEREGEGGADVLAGEHHHDSIHTDTEAAGRGHRVLEGAEEVLVQGHRLGVAGRGLEGLLGQPAALLDRVDEFEYAVPISAPKATRSQRSASRGSDRWLRVSGDVSNGKSV